MSASEPAVPTVAIIGPTGFIGSFITPAFVKAANANEITLRLLTRDVRKPTISSYLADGGEGVKACGIDYDQPSTLEGALRGVHVLVNVMGAEGDFEARKALILDAACKARVKVYFPSEWGTNHNRTKRHHPIFESKARHHHEAERRGLKVVAVYTGLIIEFCFCKWFGKLTNAPLTSSHTLLILSSHRGIDSAANTWLIPGTGDEPNAMTSQADLGNYALRAVLMSFHEPEKVPAHLEIYSDKGYDSLMTFHRAAKCLRYSFTIQLFSTWNSYADSMARAAGKPVQRKYVSLEEAVREYDAVKDGIPPHMLGPFLPVLCAENVFDHSEAGVELLNPSHEIFRPKTVDDYAQEVEGKPWFNSTPWGS
ncbi:NAD(P)-binding protein [Heliocybe sulcata]|uniref:NAD(P)-binding protein n=1 Tax=Heliocybe sulcata TaxID=5364 RepID=A0A5C3N9L3_9AGAM|nr:NAD(P)-binding protein [Heliocybe sulcata]